MANHTPRNVAPGLGRTETNPTTNDHTRFTRDEIRRVFERYDSNGDGKLDRKELRQAFKLGLGSKCGRFRAQRALHHFDEYEDGYITLSKENMDRLVEYAYNCGYDRR